MNQTPIDAAKPGLMRRGVAAAVILAILAAFTLSIVNLLFGDTWFADTFVHFRIQYLIVGLIGLVLAMWRRQMFYGVLSATVIALNTLPVMNYFAVPGIGQAHAQEPRVGAAHEIFRIAAANVHSRNDSYEAVARWVKQEKPDIAVLIEVRRPWDAEMRKRLPEYPYQRLVANSLKSGKLVLSKLPFAQFVELDGVGARSKTPLVTLQRNNAMVRIAGLHMNWPMLPAWTADRNTELVRLARLAQQDAPPLIALGDFNVSPFSRHFQRLEKDGNLRRASAGRGWHYSWPTFFMPAGIQIDHIMIAPSIKVLDFKSGAGLNSDHKWVMADLQVPIPTR